MQLTSRQDGIAVIGKGLNAGEKVVVGGQYRLANNVKVKVETAGNGPAAAPAGGLTGDEHF